ncbi:hypothetical protein WN51_07001 [Melipona quadrifasciata]|uniref:Uncharacterized protein n=1 Tax=Melipona quadrifasciata TaxID=166423 RepID=A0A0M8ZSP7_9HYME|nr:hypothetical protein WN51_07001 [Melipona quadrifasciata]
MRKDISNVYVRESSIFPPPTPLYLGRGAWNLREAGLRHPQRVRRNGFRGAAYYVRVRRLPQPSTSHVTGFRVGALKKYIQLPRSKRFDSVNLVKRSHLT